MFFSAPRRPRDGKALRDELVPPLHRPALLRVSAISLNATGGCALQAPALGIDTKPIKNAAKLQLPSKTILSGSLTKAQLGERCKTCCENLLRCAREKTLFVTGMFEST